MKMLHRKRYETVDNIMFQAIANYCVARNLSFTEMSEALSLVIPRTSKAIEIQLSTSKNSIRDRAKKQIQPRESIEAETKTNSTKPCTKPTSYAEFSSLDLGKCVELWINSIHNFGVFAIDQNGRSLLIPRSHLSLKAQSEVSDQYTIGQSIKVKIIPSRHGLGCVGSLVL